MEELQVVTAATVTSEQPSGLLDAFLPPTGCARWVVSRKAQVVSAVNSGLITTTEACERYDLSLEELGSWQRLYTSEGEKGLRAERVQYHRDIAGKPSQRRRSRSPY